MKLDELKKIIRTEVRQAIKAELKDILVEAVCIASKQGLPVKENPPVKSVSPPNALEQPRDHIQSILAETRQQMVQEFMRSRGQAEDKPATYSPGKAQAIARELNLTGDLPKEEVDISKVLLLGKKAKQVLDLVEQKEQIKRGV